MAYKIVVPIQEIEEVLNWASEAVDTGSKYPGMTYEEGVEAMFRWLVGDCEEKPNE